MRTLAASDILRIWETGEPYLRLAELTEVAQGLVEMTGSNRMSVQQSAHDIGSGSLLVRTEDNLFGFIHWYNSRK